MSKIANSCFFKAKSQMTLSSGDLGAEKKEIDMLHYIVLIT